MYKDRQQLRSIIIEDEMKENVIVLGKQHVIYIFS